MLPGWSHRQLDFENNFKDSAINSIVYPLITTAMVRVKNRTMGTGLVAKSGHSAWTFNGVFGVLGLL